MPPAQTTIRCSNCGQPVNAAVQTIIDATSDPDAKVMLVTGYLNTAQCANCSAVNKIETPLLYHDASHELFLAYVPPQIGIKHGGEEKVVADLLNTFQRGLPEGQFKGYMFSPTRVLTLQGMVDRVLEADGVTPEMMEAQRKRVDLAGQLLGLEDDQLPAAIAEYDEQITLEFFQTLTAMAQRMLQEGDSGVAERIVQLQGYLMQLSTYGQQLVQEQQEQEVIVQEIAGRIQSFGASPTRQQLLDLVVEFSDDRHRIEAVVGLVRPAFDYEFFQLMTNYIEKAPEDQREELDELRKRIAGLTAMIDRQSQMAMQQAAQLLQVFLSNENPDQLILENIAYVDDIFMTVLEANIQEAERQSNLVASAKMKEIRQKIISALQAQMQPELRFVDELLGLESDDAVRSRIAETAPEFGPEILEVMDAVYNMLQQQKQSAMMDRLDFIRRETSAALQ